MTSHSLTPIITYNQLQYYINKGNKMTKGDYIIYEFEKDITLGTESLIYKTVISEHIFENDSRSNARQLKKKLNRYLRNVLYDESITFKVTITLNELIPDSYYNCFIIIDVMYHSVGDFACFGDISHFRSKKYTLSVFGETPPL